MRTRTFSLALVLVAVAATTSAQAAAECPIALMPPASLGSEAAEPRWYRANAEMLRALLLEEQAIKSCESKERPGCHADVMPWGDVIKRIPEGWSEADIVNHQNIGRKLHEQEQELENKRNEICAPMQRNLEMRFD